MRQDGFSPFQCEDSNTALGPLFWLTPSQRRDATHEASRLLEPIGTGHGTVRIAPVLGTHRQADLDLTT